MRRGNTSTYNRGPILASSRTTFVASLPFIICPTLPTKPTTERETFQECCLMLQWMISSLCKSFAWEPHCISGEKFIAWLPSGDLRNVNYYLNIVPFSMSRSACFIISPASQNADCDNSYGQQFSCTTIASHLLPRWRRVGVLAS